jgi:hypothetical protein
VILPFFESITDLDLPNQDDLVSKLTDESFIKRAISGNISFAEQALRDQADHSRILLAILKGRLDQHNDQFKDLAEKLVAKINQSGIDLDENATQLYEALVVGNSGLTTQFAPKQLDKIKASYERDIQNRRSSNLFDSSKI